MKIKKKLFGLLLMFCLLGIPASAMAADKGYTISSSNTKVYSNTALTRSLGTIYGSDEVTINFIAESYTKVTYPISGGRTKTGYIKSSALFTAMSGTNYKAKSKTTTYRRPGGSSYGYVSAGDTVLVLGKSGSYTQIRYPVSGGYKFAFVKDSDLSSKIIGSSDNYVNISNGTYTFTSAVKNGMVMDVDGARSDNGTNIHLWESSGGSNQIFEVVAVGSGWYKILCAANGKAVDVSGGSTQSGTNVQLYEYNGTDAQLWKFYSAGNGYYYVKNKLGHQLDVNGAASSNGTNIQVWESNTTNAQKWKLTATTYRRTATTYYVTTTAGLILRSQASTSSAKLTTMPYKAAFSVTSTSGNWAYGTYNGRTGYASLQYLSTTKPVDPPSGSWQAPMRNYYCTWKTKTNMSWGGVNTSKPANRRYHCGIDIASSDEKVYAASSGTVKYKGYTSGNGLHVILQHSLGGKTVYTLYSHLNYTSYTNNLYTGKKVNVGDVIGIYGTTGGVGRHLHFAVFTGYSSDPWGYVSAFSGNKTTYKGMTFYNPVYVIQNGRLP